MSLKTQTRHLIAYRAIMNTGTITAAAEVVNLSQPAVSRLLAALELDVGFPLFYRRGRRLVPTVEGRSFFQQIEGTLAGIDDIAGIANDIRLNKQGRMRICAIGPLIFGNFVPEGVKRFQREFPNASFTIDMKRREDIDEWVVSRQADLGFTLLPVESLAVEWTPITTVAAVAIVPPDHRLARKTALTPEDLRGELWPQQSNAKAKEYIAALGGEVVGEEYAPLGPGNKFDDAVTRIKAAEPDLVLITLVGGDNVNFNRAFAGFGLDKSIRRLSLLCEELTLQGIGAENSGGLFSCMSYFTVVNSPANTAFKERYATKFGKDAPPLSMIGVDAYSGTNCAAALLNRAGSNEAAAVMAASSDLQYKTATGTGIMVNRHVAKNMYLAECKGVDFEVIETFEHVEPGETCSG